ncbi:helix-turn-helix transcriptional regulator [Geomonas sp. Red32]|uniref:helix-turn-helix domain-containing protein n=1 Tax=Geomonas sp. Red32 TaxID=2912856 RepID=UPI00202CAF8F|nr:helix-turn-helix transcriptional regulator [Geomonas sp. Red32]MCM0083931.1 helix-turn-helix transcriptional regulator [Geomonas sp. Red32]
MLERTKKPHTEVAHFAGPAKKLQELRAYAAKLGCQEVDESVAWREAFPEFQENAVGSTLAGYRHRQGLTQVELSASTGIPQRHISEMENGKRIIGVVNAKRLAAVLDCDHRRLL